MEECIFCKMFSGEMETRKIYEDENVLGIVDTQPRFVQGQCLVMHKKHVRQFYELEDEEIAQLFRGVKIVATKLNRAFAPSVISLWSRGLGIPHAHIFVYPSFDGGIIENFVLSLWKEARLAKESTDSKLDEIAEKIRLA